MVKTSIAKDTCTLAKLEGCAAAFDHLVTLAGVLAELPGSDDTLESVSKGDAGWGIYKATAQDYAMFPTSP